MSQHLVVLDASALLALLNQENGADEVAGLLPHSVMSSVNLAEVIKVLVVDKKIPLPEARLQFSGLVSHIQPFTEEQAYLCASLVEKNKKYGLSLGDRACLSLAIEKKYPVYTADKIWAKLEIDNLKIHLIR